MTVALWSASAPAPRWVRAALPALAILAVAPNLSWGAWARTPDVPHLFTGGGYRDCIARGENVVVFPVGPRGDSLIWQAESGFWFRMAGGYISQAIPPSFTRPAGLAHLTTADNPSEVTAAQIRELGRLKGVTKVIVDARQAALWRPILRPLGEPIAAGGTLIYRLPGAPPVDPALRPAGDHVARRFRGDARASNVFDRSNRMRRVGALPGDDPSASLSGAAPVH